MTAQGHPRTVFRRAIAARNLLVAEVTAREIGQVDLREALELVVLIAQKDPRRRSRACARWLQRYLDEHPVPTIEEVQLAVGALAALGGPSHDVAAATLSGMAERATSPKTLRRLR